ncbi:hypothetical protein [Corynebacterium sp. CCUG 70398]|uniref:hypothetical protein n=1 Tax=Corynebacterium sp. CCUG 70398 TaxID=2823891 RepID=UPI00210A7CDB|nr:hypothetical protein [Corynebacterium sp. CCUG 70398]MCQ4622056.1 hypothetical protein [Corynebacterium sp. CCUG 70398]
MSESTSDDLVVLLADGEKVVLPDGLEHSDPLYVVCFWEYSGDGEKDYFIQRTEIVRGATDVLQVIDYARESLAEDELGTTFGVFVIPPDPSGTREHIDLVRLYGEVPEGPFEEPATFGWTMYVAETEASGTVRGIGDPPDPREARLLRAGARVEK